MFTGEYHNKMDKKSRIGIPIRFRELLMASEIQSGLYQTPSEKNQGDAVGKGLKLKASRGFENCVWIFTTETWKKYCSALAGNPLTDRALRDLQRFFMGSAVDVEIDSLGRILIPQPLKQYAGLDRECVVVGVGDMIEIWAMDKWEKYSEERLDSDKLTRELESRGSNVS